MEITGKLIQGQKVDIFSEQVPLDDLPKTLKQEIIYIMYGMPDKKKPKDFKETQLNMLKDSDGNLTGFHYIGANLSDGESKKYIYDEARDVIFKVDGTNILGTTVHSYEYACKLKGVPYRSISVDLNYSIPDESNMFKKGNIAYYEPDLQNFNAGVVSLVYYQKKNDGSLGDELEVPYTLSELTAEAEIDGDNYIWYDYSNKVWANIKCVSSTDLTSYWVWIPRYAYKINGSNVDIKYITDTNEYYDSETDSYKAIDSNEYVVAAAFEQGGQHLKGIWMSKYEPSKIEK